MAEDKNSNQNQQGSGIPIAPDAIFHVEDDQSMFDSVRKMVRRAGVTVGAVELIVGIILLFWPSKTLTAVTVVLGIALIAIGGVYTVAVISAPVLPPGWRVLGVGIGILLIMGGIAILKAPSAAGLSLAVFVTIVLGMAWIIDGIGSLFQSAFTASPAATVAYGLISILAGIVVLAAPEQSTVFLFMFVAVALIVMGISAIVRALTFGGKRG